MVALVIAFPVLVTGLPADGRTIWARLSSNLSGTWQFFDYSYRAASPQPQPSGVISIDERRPWSLNNFAMAART